MITQMYEQYLWLIGKLKDEYGLHVDVDHRNVHTFYDKKIPLFKLMFGTFTGKDQEEIVCSFHIDLKSTDAIQWFMRIQNYHPDCRLTEIYIEDDAGETYVGEDAQKIKDLKLQREVLKLWEGSKKQEIQDFKASKIVGRIRTQRVFSDSQADKDKAIMEFDLMKYPIDDGEVQ